MNLNNSKAPALRKLLLFSIIFLFLFIGSIFIYQYRQYSAIEKRLNDAYKSHETSTIPLNNLFSTFSEAENTFRLYTLDFSEEVYTNYVNKLDTTKHYIDSLVSLPILDHALNPQLLKIDDRKKMALEFALLKKKVDQLMLHTSDSLKLLNTVSKRKVPGASMTLDSVLLTVSMDTSSMAAMDTIVRERPGLLKRIFSSKNDTIIVRNENSQRINREQLAIIRQNVSANTQNAASFYMENMDVMRGAFAQLRQKERQLVATNFDLLNGLKESMETIRLLERTALRQAEEEDFAIYRENAGLFGMQLIFALALMLVMLLALIYYHIYASSNEHRLYQEKEYAAKLAEEKTSILAGISHEIRTPLHSLMGIVDLLKNRINLEKGDAQLVDSAYYSINNINSTITDILSLSKLEAASKGEIVLDYFSPVQTFLNVIALYQNQAELKNLTLEAEINIDPKTQVLSNEFRIKQIASNFLSNAIKYAHNGTISFRATIEKSNEPLVLHLEVEDSGIGIADENKHQVFRKYYMVNANNNTGGVGLGLYISKIMTEDLGGKINFSSQQGVGSTFYVDIPFKETIIATDEKRDARLADLPNHLRILIVDDHPINILYMKQFFKNFNELHAVNSGTEALLALAQRRFDIVITDINMPDMRGEELLQRIRSQKELQSLKVLAISADMGMMNPAVGKSGELVGFDGFIDKPFTENELVKVLINALNERKVGPHS